MKAKFNKFLSVFLSVAITASAIIVASASDKSISVSAESGKTVGKLSVGESYTFNFNEGEVIKTLVNKTTSLDADGNSFIPFMGSNKNGNSDTATQANIDTDGDGVADKSTLKYSVKGPHSLYIPTDKNGTPLVVEPNATYKVSMKVYVEAKAGWGQFFAGGGVNNHGTMTNRSTGMIYDVPAVYNGGELSYRSESRTFTTNDFRTECGKFMVDGVEYKNYFYIYSSMTSAKFDGTNDTPSVVYIDSVTITKIKDTTPVGETTTFEFDTVNATSSTDAEGYNFTTFSCQYPSTSSAEQVNLDLDGDGVLETSALELSITGWSNALFVPTDENGQPFIIEPNSTYSVTINAYIKAKSGWGQFFVGGGYSTRDKIAHKSGGMMYDVPAVYDGGKLIPRTASSTFTTGDYTLSGNTFTLDGASYYNYFYLQSTFGYGKFDGVNDTASVVYLDSITITKTSQTVKVTLDANGGTFSDGSSSLLATERVGEAFTAEAPTSEAGAFAGWSYTADGMPMTKATSAMHGKTLYAVYKNPVNITLNANGGKFSENSIINTTQFEGTYLNYDTPTNGSAKFLGWASSPAATEKLASYMITADMEGKTLYAIWKKEPHGSYSTFERYVDYSSYTVNPWSGGNSWWIGDNPKHPWFTLVSDESANGGKYLKFSSPALGDPTETLANEWLGHYNITMTDSGNYNASGAGNENLYLPENTTYRVTLKVRTKDFSGENLQLYVSYGNMHHTAFNQTTTLLSNISDMKDWTEISAVFTTPAEYKNGNLCFIGITAGGNVKLEYHLDSLRLERVTATTLYTVKDGKATKVRTLYGVPGTDLPSELREEVYSSEDNTGYATKLTLGGKVFSDKALTEKTLFKFANCDLDVYTSDFEKGLMNTENQEAYCGFDVYENNGVSGFDINLASVTDKVSYSGEKSLKINANVNTAFEIKNIDSLRLGTGKTYKVTIWYKSDSNAQIAVGTALQENLFTATFPTKEVSGTTEFTKASYLITPDKAYNEGYVPVIYVKTGDSPIYIDNITVSSAAAFVGGFKTGNDDLRFVMSYKGAADDGNKITIDGSDYTVVERGALITGADNEAAVLEVGTDSEGVMVVSATDLSDNFDFAEGTTLYSVLLDGVNASDTYKFAVRGYLKFSSGEIYYTEITDMTAEEAKIATPTAKGTGEVLYNGIVIPEDWSGAGMENYGTNELPVPYLENKPETINIDVGRQLFVDDFLISDTNLTRTWHKAVEYEGNPIFKAETDIELGLPFNGTYNHGASAKPFSDGVWYDSEDGLYKMWYMAGSYYGTALATSKDGINWERGEYDVIPGTNLVIDPKDTKIRDSNAIIINPYAKLKSERYNMLQVLDPANIVGKIYTSADGIHWNFRTKTAYLGDRSTIFYNPFRQKWVYSIRSYWHNRSRDYSENDSLIKGANLANSVHWLRTDNKDLRDPVIGDNPQLYNFDAVAYESIMLGAFLIYQGPDNSITDATGIPKVANIHLGFSRDGFHYSRSEDRTAFLSCSQEAGTWDRGYLSSNAGVCMVNDDELWFYYAAFAGDETLANTGSCVTSGNYSNGATGLAKLRRDGFASMDGTGILTTEKVAFSGKYLYVNANASGGSLKAELLDANGKVIPGYSVNDCVALTEDSTKTKLSFGEGKDLSAFAGKGVKLRFYLENAELYSFWVTGDGENGASNGYLAAGSVGQKGLIDTKESYK